MSEPRTAGASAEPGAPVGTDVLAVEAEGLRARGPSAGGGLDLELEAGSVAALVGPDGSGTSSILALLATVLRPVSGRLTIMGVDARRSPRAARRHVGYVGHAHGGDEAATVREHLRVHAACQGVGRKERSAAVDAVLELFDLAAVTELPMARLSQGWRRRAQLAAAFVHTPDVLVLDEPFAGIDARAQHELKRLLAELSQLGTTIVLSTDHLAGLEDLCTAVGVVDRGLVEHWGTPDEVIAQSQARAGGGREVRVRMIDGTESSFRVAGDDERRWLLARLLQDGHQVVDFHVLDSGLDSVIGAGALADGSSPDAPNALDDGLDRPAPTRRGAAR